MCGATAQEGWALGACGSGLVRGLRAVAIAGAVTLAATACASGKRDGRTAFAAPSPPPLAGDARLEVDGEAPPPADAPEASPDRARRRSSGRDDGDLAALRQDVAALEAEISGLRPGIGRLLDIENDIRALLSQLAAISSVTRSGAPTPASGGGAGAPASPLTPLSPLSAEGRDPGGAPGAATSAPTPLTPLAVTGATPPLDASPLDAPTTASTPSATTGQTPLGPSGEPPPARPPTAPPRAPPGAPPAAAGVYLHLASYRDARTAQSGWDELTADHGDVLAGLSSLIRETDLGDKGVYQRLYAGPTPDRATAVRLCARLKARDVYCAVTVLEGAAARASPPATRARPTANVAAPPLAVAPPSDAVNAAPPATGAGGAYAFLGAYRDEATAARGRDVFAATHADVVDSGRLAILRDDAGAAGAAWRLAAGPFASVADAEAVCAQLRTRGAFCTVSDDTPRS